VSKYIKKKNRFAGVKVIALCILVVVIAVTITAVRQREKYETQIADINAHHELEMIALRTELRECYESQMAELERYYEYGGDITQIELEAEYIAKVMYMYYKNHADSDMKSVVSDMKSVVWCVINRVEHYAYPNTVVEVCEQPKQWMGYSSDNPVLTELYDLALTELKIWHNDGHRPISNDYIYLSWSSKEIALRDTFEENDNTHYWRMK
jgi:hypothetical protein